MLDKQNFGGTEVISVSGVRQISPEEWWKKKRVKLSIDVESGRSENL